LADVVHNLENISKSWPKRLAIEPKSWLHVVNARRMHALPNGKEHAMTTTKTNTIDIENRLVTIFEDILDALEFGDDEQPMDSLPECVEGIERISSFDDAGILTTDEGLVLSMNDGTEFQITIVRSK